MTVGPKELFMDKWLANLVLNIIKIFISGNLPWTVEAVVYRQV